MKTVRANPYNSVCPSRQILALIGSKWAMLIVCLLREGPLRTGVMKRRLDGISQKMLTQTLRELELHGIVQRTDHGEVPPHVDYRLTKMGRSLAGLVQRLEDWVVANYSRMTAVVDSFASQERV